jgi:ligand-binding SRPBCC domain-containing protein
MSIYTLTSSQIIPASVEEVWDFMSSPRNLQKITPPYMGFEIITDPLPEKIYAGMIIQYKVSPLLKIKLRWVTEITQVNNLHYFVDEQKAGPYKIWHHQHLLSPTAEGTLMQDIVTYQPPFYLLGSIANAVLIKKQLKSIFEFRKLAVETKFGLPTPA